MKAIQKNNLQEGFHHLLRVLGSQRFLRMQGLGNEVPFFICPFDPVVSVDVERIRGQLKNRLEQAGVQVLEVNLYDLSVQLMKDRDVWDQVLEIEAETSKAELQELLQGILDPQDHLIPAISDAMTKQDYDVLFLSGVGEVFPYIRSHNVLNNLQSKAKLKPTLMFFPGEYTHSLEAGASLLAR